MTKERSKTRQNVHEQQHKKQERKEKGDRECCKGDKFVSVFEYYQYLTINNGIVIYIYTHLKQPKNLPYFRPYQYGMGHAAFAVVCVHTNTFQSNIQPKAMIDQIYIEYLSSKSWAIRLVSCRITVTVISQPLSFAFKN